jgi:large subunit ribosomal protein L15
MKQHELKPAPGSHRPRKRIGRGISAGQGKTSGRGQKGQGARSSVDIPVGFEGGQMRLNQRLPKLRGFVNFARTEYAVVNTGKLNRFEAGTAVGPDLLLQAGLIRKPLDGVKILAAGQLKVALKVSAHRFSAGARERIEEAGGSVELLEGEPEPEKTKRSPAARAAAAASKKAAAKPEPASDKAPAGKGAKPAAKGAAKGQSESASAAGGAAPAAGQAEPATGQAEPATGQAKPVADQAEQQAANQAAPAAGEAAPAAGEAAPAATGDETASEPPAGGADQSTDPE